MPEAADDCFVITPIGADNSEIRRSAEGVIESVVKPVLENEDDFNFHVVVAHTIAEGGSINNQILTHILQDKLVIANLTGLNANVMYELAVRHAVRKPIVHICEKGTALPFDLKDERTLFYSNDMMGVIELKDRFRIAVKAALSDSSPNNPVYRAATLDKVMQDISVNEPQKYLEATLLDRLDKIENSIMSMSNRNAISVPESEGRSVIRYRVILDVNPTTTFGEVLNPVYSKMPEGFLEIDHVFVRGIPGRSKVRPIPYTHPQIVEQLESTIDGDQLILMLEFLPAAKVSARTLHGLFKVMSEGIFVVRSVVEV